MPRLASIEKGGYYAFPDEFLPAVASLIAPAKQGGKLLDPCAGEGRALDSLARAWNVTPYANELDDERAAACKTLFGGLQTVQGDLNLLRASLGSFTGLWVNPPYTWDTTGDDKRREFAMLKFAWKWVQPGGLVFWVIYSHHLTYETAAYITNHSSSVDVWQLPGVHLGTYTHIVVVARAGVPMGDPGQDAIALVKGGELGLWPTLTVQDSPCYELPAPVARKSFVFCPQIVSPEAALAAINESGIQFSTTIQALLTPNKPPEKISPVVRPRGGQLALILAAGLFNGLVLPTEGGCVAVRSTVESVEKLVATQGDATESDDIDVVVDETNVGREVFRTTSVVTITLLGDDGSIDDISGDGPIVRFIKDYKPALMKYLDDHFTPLYNFDYTPWAGLLMRPKGGKLYQTQKHVIAACVTALEHRKSAILVGEPGSGKSIMGATVAAALHDKMKPGQVVIIMCPPHLVEKWIREISHVGVPVYSRILKNVEDVVSFMDQAAVNDPMLLNIGVISREGAKLGEGWSSSVEWRSKRFAKWALNAPPPTDEDGCVTDTNRLVTMNVPHCPTCGAEISKNTIGHADKRSVKREHGVKAMKLEERDLPTEQWIARLPRFCNACGNAMWQRDRTFSKGKMVNDQPKTPRVPLAEIIATRYGDRLYLYIADELHELKSASTDQGEAMSVLANAATKTLGLTGTLYGGSASTLYAIEYLFNARIRQQYPWGRGMNDWVRDMGCLERIVEYKPQFDDAGVYSGKRRVNQQPREAPGCSPLLVAEIIDHCVFVGLSDMGRKMPDFEEIPVPITPDSEVADLYFHAKDKLGQYLFKCRLEGDSSALGMYLQTLLSWPSAPYKTELCIHRKRLSRESNVVMEISAHTIPALSATKIYAKEEWLIDTVRNELAEGRGVAVFVRQTGTRDIQPRIARLLTENIPDVTPFILRGTVKADTREGHLDEQIKDGANVLICNPRLVQTGLDLLDFPTIIFFEVDYSLYVMGQASRRAWRLIQDQACKVYYPYYTGLMENQAVELIGRKQQAASLLYGEAGGSGLSALNGDDGGNLLAALASELGNDSSVTNLTDLFAKHANEVFEADSAWFIEQEFADDTAIVDAIQPPEPEKPKKLKALKEGAGLQLTFFDL